MIIDMYAHHISRRVGEMLLKGKYYGPGREFPFPTLAFYNSER